MKARRSAFTLVELLVVIAIIGILIALLLPAVQAAREAARRAQCNNNMKQLGLALQNYHDVNRSLPFGKGGTAYCNSTPVYGNCSRVSGFIPMLPFLEQQAIYDQIRSGGNGYAAYGPPGWYGWTNWNYTVPGLICPSDIVPVPSAGSIGQNNYGFSRGDSIYNNCNNSTSRGLFAVNNTVTIAMITDGTSNTLAMAERCRALSDLGNSPPLTGPVPIRSGDATGVTNLNNNPATNPGICLAQVGSGNFYATPGVCKTRWGRLWTDGQMERVGITTVIAPNGPSCTGDTNVNADSASVIAPPSSYHPGGALAAFADGSVRFISETIDTGNLSYTEVTSGPSPYGVWGALGSKDGGEGTSNQ